MLTDSQSSFFDLADTLQWYYQNFHPWLKAKLTKFEIDLTLNN